MNATTVAVDLAKNVFELAVADEHWKVIERARLTRGQFERWFQNRAVRLVVMEACATAHYWARTLRPRGIEVRLLPAQYVRAYVKRNKTDAADALALLEAARGSDIKPVAVKSVEQQRGNRYVRMLLTHGARSVLRAATVARRAGRNVDRLRSWALKIQERTNHNKATCALANKLARIAWAVWVKHERYQAA
jgi:Transposase